MKRGHREDRHRAARAARVARARLAGGPLPTAGRILWAAVLLLFVQSVTALDLSWQPQLRLGTRATDNLFSRSGDEEAAWGFDTGGGLRLQAMSPEWQSTITPAFNFRRFAFGENADADEYNVRTQHQWAFNERALATLNVDYVRDSTLTTEVTDFGRINSAVNRDTVMVNPGIVLALDERTQVNLGFMFSDVAFEAAQGSGFVDYDYKQATTQVNHAYNEALTFFATAYVSGFRTPDTGGSSFTYGGQGGVTHRYSETLEGDFAVGYTTSDIDFLEQRVTGFQFIGFDPVTGTPLFLPIVALVESNASNSGPIASANIRKTFDRTRAELIYARAVSPSTGGAQTLSDDIQLTVEHDLSARLKVGLRGGYNMRSTESDDLQFSARQLNRNQALVGGNITYRFTRETAIVASYRFIWNELDDPSRSIYGNTVFMTLTYNGEPQHYYGY